MKRPLLESSAIMWLLAAIPSSIAFIEVRTLRCNLVFGSHTRDYKVSRFQHEICSTGISLSAASLSSDDAFSELRVALLDESTSDLLAEEVLSLVDVPFVPGAIVEFVVNWVIKAMASDLSPKTMIRLNALLEAENTYSESDDASSENRNALADDIALELASKLDVPIMDEDQEIEILRNTVRTALAVLTTSSDEFREARVAFSLDATQDLLQGAEGRRKLAEMLNAQVDVPFLGEAEEQELLENLLGNCADSLQSLLPEELVIRLRGESTDGLKDIKDHLISRIDNRVELGILVPRDKKLWVIEKVVDSVVDLIVGDTEAELFLMDTDERRTKLVEIRKLLEYEVDLNRKAFEKQQEALKDQIDRINQSIEEINA